MAITIAVPMTTNGTTTGESDSAVGLGLTVRCNGVHTVDSLHGWILDFVGDGKDILVASKAKDEDREHLF
jgi:hypothetical protein